MSDDETERTKAVLRRWYDDMWVRGNWELVPELAGPTYTRHEFGATRVVTADEYAQQVRAVCEGTTFTDLSYRLIGEGDRVETFRRGVDVNLVGVYALVDAARDALCRHGGKVIVMGSGAGYRPFPGGAAYSASKAAVAMLVRVLAVELREHQVAVNEIVPGPVRTELASTAVDRTRLPSAVASEWFKEPDDVVDLALFLAGLPDHGPTGQRFSLLGRDG